MLCFCVTQKHNKFRWLASVINFKLLHTGCPIAHPLSVVFNRFVDLMPRIYTLYIPYIFLMILPESDVRS